MALNWNLTTKGMRPHGQLHTKLEEKLAKLEHHLEQFPADAVHLQVNLERHPRKPLFAAALTLHLPSNILQSEKQAPDPVPALDKAVKALLRCCAKSRSSSPPCATRATGSESRSGRSDRTKSDARRSGDLQPGGRAGSPLHAVNRQNRPIVQRRGVQGLPALPLQVPGSGTVDASQRVCM